MIHLIVFSYLTGLCLTSVVHQSPTEVITSTGKKVEITCRHKIPSYYRMFWYQQSYGETEMKLIGYLTYTDPTMENDYNGQFTISGDLNENREKYSSLQFQSKPEHKAFYWCAATYAHVNSNPAYFGSGTKLTVLEHNISEPQVEIFTPAEKECQASSQRKAWKKTLVCVASGFYPDHVDVNWDIDGTRATQNVATDSLAQKEEEGSHKYRITSRLMVEAQTWARAGIKYTCAVSFYNGTRRSVFEVTQENPSPNNVPNTVRFQRLSQGAKLSYVTLIVKSALYAAFVVLLLWKLKGPRSAH
ncbi:T cell receptor beta chain MC.7.G5-like isoform 2-T2 [Synchiropus picturatus]